VKLPLAADLPCYPCPHQSACCSWGTDLLASEAEAIVAAFGPTFVTVNDVGEARTAMHGDRCVFLQSSGCSIHNEAFYPRVCAGFPWRDDLDRGPYEGDLTICPELASS